MSTLFQSANSRMLPSPLSPSEESVPPKFTFPEVPKTASNSSRPRLIPQEDPSIFPHVRQVDMGSTSAIASLISWKDPRQVCAWSDVFSGPNLPLTEPARVLLCHACPAQPLLHLPHLRPGLLRPHPARSHHLRPLLLLQHGPDREEGARI